MTGRITLGFLIDRLDTDYSRRIVAGIEGWSRANDANLFIFSGRGLGSPRGHEYQNNVIYDYIRKGAVDALVMASGTQTSHLSPAQFASFVGRFEGIPKVSIGLRMEGIPSVLVDNGSGIHQAMEHLARAHGHRRIAFLAGPDTNEEAAARSEAYRQSVASLGLDNDPSLHIRGGDFTQGGAREALITHLQARGRPDFQALLAANDEMAIGAMQVLGEHGYSIPREIAVIGFDDIISAQFTVPSMTTVDQSLHDQGWNAAAFAAQLARGGHVPETIVLPTRLELRTSCGCMPRSVSELEGLSTVPGEPRAGQDPAEVVERCLARAAGEARAAPDQALREILLSLVRQSGSEGFLTEFRGAVIDQVTSGADTTYWQSLLVALQEELIAGARLPQEVTALSAAFQKARVLLGEILRTEQGKLFSDLLAHLQELRSAMEGLISVSSVEDLMHGLAQELRHLDITTCFIAVYSTETRHRRGQSWVIPARADLMLAFIGGERVAVRGDETSFLPSEHLVPPALLPRSSRLTLVVTALFFREEQIGYLLYEPGSRAMEIYETFCVQLSNILMGSRLLAARHKAEERLRHVLAELEEYNQKLSGLSQTDELTGLYNRRAFLSLGTQNLAQARRLGRPGSVFFVDLDDLKKINDSLGHLEGDYAIRQAARILTETFRHMDIIARLGGDEFTVLAIDTGPDFQSVLMKRLEAALMAYNAGAGKPYALSMSVGAVSFDEGSPVSLEGLMNRADEILYTEKKRRRGQALPGA